MKSALLNLLFFFLIVLSLSWSRNTSNNVQDTIQQKTGLLISGPWKLIAYRAWTIMGDADWYPGYPDCKKDNLTIFYSGGNGEYNEGSTKCDPSALQAHGLQWAFKYSGTYISIDNEDWRIDQLSSTTLILFQRASNTNEYEATYVHN